MAIASNHIVVEGEVYGNGISHHSAEAQELAQLLRRWLTSNLRNFYFSTHTPTDVTPHTAIESVKDSRYSEKKPAWP